PLASGSKRPRRRTTPRSHSLMMYSEFQNQMSPNNRITRIGRDKPNSPMLTLLEDSTCDLNPENLCEGASSVRRFNGLDGERQSVDADHFYRTSGWNRLHGDGTPQFPMNANHAFGTSDERGFGDTLRAEQLFLAGSGLPFARANDQSHQHHGEHCK